MTQKQCTIWGAFLCGSAVILGAFGAHLLEKWLSETAINSFEVGIRYQFFHGLALLFLSLDQNKKKFARTSALLFLFGVIVFSGSIYGLTFASTISNPIFLKILGPITPVGGLLLIFGWANLLAGYIRNN